MEDILIQKARAYAALNQLSLAERLGFGIHGMVFVAENNSKPGKTAIKVHRMIEPFERECAVYERLRASEVTSLCGFHVPQLIRIDNRLLVVEMTVVVRPFVLDFAGAYLDIPPDFPEEIWIEWEEEKREQFDGYWPQVREVLGELEGLGVHMVDVSPSNVAFLQ